MRAMQLDRLYYGVRDRHGALRGQLEGLLIVSIVAGHKAKAPLPSSCRSVPGQVAPGPLSALERLRCIMDCTDLFVLTVLCLLSRCVRHFLG